MTRKRGVVYVLCAFVAYVPLLTSFAQDVQFSGSLQTVTAVCLPWTDNAGDFSESSIALNADLDVYGEESTLCVKGKLLFDALYAQSSTERLSYISGNGLLSATLTEAWYDYGDSWWSLRIGRQIEAWGKADALTVTDVLCPSDNTTLFADDIAESRLGIDAARFSVTTESLIAEMYWIPVFTPATLPLKAGNPLRATLLPSSVTLTGDNVETPSLSIQNGEYALRLSSYMRFADVSLYGFYGWDDMPIITYKPTAQGIQLLGEYERMGMIGADAAIPVKEITLRLEGAVFPQRAFSVSAKNQLMGKEAYIRRTELTALCGIDWMPAGWTLTAQYYADFVFGDTDLLERDFFEHKATLSVSRSFFADTLELSLSGILGLNDFDSAISFTAEYSLSDQISLSAGGILFFAGLDEDGEFGSYKDISSALVKGVFRF